MTTRLRQETGSSLIVAIILIGVMMGLGLATASYVDGQQSQSGRERVRESAFNVAESALDAQVLQLAQSWPTTAGVYPTSCVPTSASNLPCPTAGSLQASATTADYNASACPAGSSTPLWTTSVRDDGGGATAYYNAQIVNAQPTFDANGNGRLWVRASGTARCNQRAVITMVNRGTISLRFPRNVVTANWFSTNNSGSKTIVDTQGLTLPAALRSPQPADLVARCTGIAPPLTPFPSTCMGFDPARGQVQPDTAKVSSTTPATALSPADLAAFESRARELGTYYAAGTCPPSLTGTAVYVEDFRGCLTATAANSSAAPGTLYIGLGTFSLPSRAVFYGLLYMGNLQASSGAVVSVGSNARIQGAVAVDGLGGVSVGQSKKNLVFDYRVFDVFKGSGAVARTPNTWRELPRGQ